MRRLGTVGVFGATVVAVSSCALGAARAQDPAPAASQATPPAEVEPEEQPSPETGYPRKAAPAARGGDVLVAAGIAALAPAGSVAGGVPSSALIGSGYEIGGQLGYGLGRYGVLEGTVGYGILSGSTACSLCSGRTLSVGAGLVYHVAQGIAVDPWLSYGLAYRSTSFSLPAGAPLRVAGLGDGKFVGLDVARLSLGGDFYPLPSLGFGPYLELDLGTYLGRPDAAATGAVYALFGAGLRVHFDPMRALAAPAKTARGRVPDTAASRPARSASRDGWGGAAAGAGAPGLE